MKIACLLTLLLTLLASASVAFAQSKKNDVLVKIDNTRIQCRVIGVTASVIRYKKVNGTTILSIGKNQVSRIIYANGSASIIKTRPLVKEKPIAGNGSAEKPNDEATRISSKPDPRRAELAEVIDPGGGPPQPKPPPVLSAKKFSIQLNGLPTFMLGSTVWTSLSDGYGHTVGAGGSVQVDYWLTKQVSVGAEIGYLTWGTQIDLVENLAKATYLIKVYPGRVSGKPGSDTLNIFGRYTNFRKI